MPPFQIQEDDITDAEFIDVDGRPVNYSEPPPQQVQPVVEQFIPDRGRSVVRLDTDVSANPSMEQLLYEKRARAVALFLRLPFFAFVALQPKMPGLVRLGAAALALWEAVELSRGGATEVQDTATEWMGQ